MPKGIPVQSPTLVYWLVCTSTGLPFYCGKTNQAPTRRLAQHMRRLNRADLRVHVVEVVQAGGNWRERERHWIGVLRAHFPDVANVKDGGQGSFTTYRHTRKAKAKIATARRGKRWSPEMRARLGSLGRKGIPKSIETRAKMSAGMKEVWRRRRAARLRVDKNRTVRTTTISPCSTLNR